MSAALTDTWIKQLPKRPSPGLKMTMKQKTMF